MTGREVVIEAPERVEVREAPAERSLAPGEARVRSVVVGICGSDVHAYRGVHPFIDLPIVPGHDRMGLKLRMRSLGDHTLKGVNVKARACRHAPIEILDTRCPGPTGGCSNRPARVGGKRR